MTSRIVALAIREAKTSRSKFRVGAVVFRGSRILGLGFNSMATTHPKSPHPYKSVHAEFDAVLSAVHNFNSGFGWNDILHGTDIYIHRLKADDTPGLAKPCVYCYRMLGMAGIRKIGYSLG